ncbi:MAG TPA: hypothetical protein VHE55_01940 [Fimbriimonadaceae bacterium]|nr:hypothetical protein [Fimbriimonadaceae bacterium]
MSLKSKSVRLWSGMDDGTIQEVRLRCTSDDRLGFELFVGREILLVPIDHAHLHAALNSREVTVEMPSCRCSMVPVDESISFLFQGSGTVRFLMRRNQFAVLAKNVGLKEPDTAP